MQEMLCLSHTEVKWSQKSGDLTDFFHVTVLSQPVGEMGFLVCVQALFTCPHITGVGEKHSSTILQEQGRSKYWYTQTSNRKLSTSAPLFLVWISFGCLWPRNKYSITDHQQQSFLFSLLTNEAVRGRKWSGGGGNRETGWGKRKQQLLC